jgi:hypothetical protein
VQTHLLRALRRRLISSWKTSFSRIDRLSSPSACWELPAGRSGAVIRSGGARRSPRRTRACLQIIDQISHNCLYIPLRNSRSSRNTLATLYRCAKGTGAPNTENNLRWPVLRTKH